MGASGIVGSARSAARQLKWTLANRLDRVGPAGSPGALERQAASYWANTDGDNWRSESHWRDGLPDAWDQVGRDTLGIATRLAGTTGRPLPAGRTVEWGCGGGANAVHLAPRCAEFVAVDIVAESVEECAAQVAAVCSTPTLAVVADPMAPEAAIESIGRGSCDLFVCVYVLELVPSPAYGLRLVEVARELLAPGGLALVQVKYATHSFTSRPRVRGYRRNPANTTTYSIDGFWTAAQRCGLTPEAVVLEPHNQLDERYAYYLLSKR